MTGSALFFWLAPVLRGNVIGLVGVEVETVDFVVGQRIRARRVAMGVSQADLGKSIGVRFQQVQKYESGANRVSASRLWAIAEALGVHISHFFVGIRASDPETGDKTAPTDEFCFLKEHDAVEMLSIYRSLKPAHKHAVLSFVRTLTQDAPVRRFDEAK
ncbi:helix-turn-helix domain-containing protein [Ruegeria hyattellae]|uniref:helix-turn-helix domain-containing protein n=1 Tax=Ruegeria hyattellae TaxID=3233337 RepID=UPI00355B1E62